MRQITHTTLRRHTSSWRTRTGHAWMVAASTCVLVIGLCLPVSATLAAQAAPAGHCRLVLRVTVVPTRQHQVGSAYESSSGTSSCTGSLGPWLMGGKAGWSTSSGRLTNVTTQNRPATANGHGVFWAVAPRRAWLRAPAVTLAGTFHLHTIGDGIKLTGSGRLVPTRQAPVASSFTLTGIASLTLHHGGAGHGGRTAGTLTIDFAVRNHS